MRSYDSTLPPVADERRPFLDRTYDDKEGRSYESISRPHEEEPRAPRSFFLRGRLMMVLLAGLGLLLSAVFFLASSVAVLLTQNHTTMHYSMPIELLGKSRQQQPQQQQVRSTTRSSAGTLSTRAQSIRPGRDDLVAFQTAAADAYSPLNNTDGYLVMLVAENRLMHHELAAKLQEVTTSSSSKNTVTIPEWVFDYGDMRGQADFRRAVAQMMESSWLQAPVDPNALVLQSGAGSILDSLAWTLADAGDGVIVTAPAYPAFASDLGTRGRLHLHVAPTSAQHNYEPTVADLDEAYARAVEAGHPPKILIVCQPNNPTGVVYSHAAMERMITWALQLHNSTPRHPRMHVVSDEIYGNSHFPGVHVTSAAQIMHELQQQQQNKLRMTTTTTTPTTWATTCT